MQNFTDPAELLAIVDADDNEIGAERRDIIHRDNLLHRAIHLFVFRPTGELLLQQRSAKKDQYPLHWECVGGHLGPGESYDLALFREAEEELGLFISHAEEISKLAACPETGYEFITVYKTITDDELRPNPEEIIATDWLTLEQVRDEVRRAARLFSPTLLHTFKHSRILDYGR